MSHLSRTILACGTAALLGLAASSSASEEPIADLADALCAAKDLNGITLALAAVSGEGGLNQQEIAEAFGLATFLGDLDRCASRQALADGFAYFKKGKDATRLDAAFAMGRVAAKPGSGAAGAETYQGSFSVLGTAGDPPSGQ